MLFPLFLFVLSLRRSYNCLSIHFFYCFGSSRTGVIFPSLLQLQRGITDIEDRKQREICAAKYKRKDEMDKGKLSEIDLEREEECGICMEMNSKVVLPICSHSMCMKCYRNWYADCYTIHSFYYNKFISAIYHLLTVILL